MNIGDLKERFPQLEVVYWHQLFKSGTRNKKPCMEMLLGEYVSVEHCRKRGESTYSIPQDRIVIYDRAYVINKLKQDLSLLMIGDLETVVDLVTEIWELKQKEKDEQQQVQGNQDGKI